MGTARDSEIGDQRRMDMLFMLFVMSNATSSACSQ